MIVALDLGSRYCGVVVLEDALPARVAASVTLLVDPTDVTETADGIKRAVDLAVGESRAQALALGAEMGAHVEVGLPRVVIEWGRFYVPAKKTPQATASAGAAMGEARDPMICIRDRVEQHCKALGVKVIRINARTWRVHLGCKGRDDRAVSEALMPHTGLAGLGDVHQRDAAGAALGVLLAELAPAMPAPPRKRSGRRWVRPSKVSPRTLAMRAQDAKIDALCEEGAKRILAAPPRVTMTPEVCPSRPCGCGARGPHRTGCALWAPPVPRASAAVGLPDGYQPNAPPPDNVIVGDVGEIFGIDIVAVPPDDFGPK